MSEENILIWDNMGDWRGRICEYSRVDNRDDDVTSEAWVWGVNAGRRAGIDRECPSRVCTISRAKLRRGREREREKEGESESESERERKRER